MLISIGNDRCGQELLRHGAAQFLNQSQKILRGWTGVRILPIHDHTVEPVFLYKASQVLYKGTSSLGGGCQLFELRVPAPATDRDRNLHALCVRILYNLLELPGVVDRVEAAVGFRGEEGIVDVGKLVVRNN